MDRVQFVEHRGKRILRMDFSRTRPPEHEAIFARARTLLGPETPPGSVLMLTLTEDAHFHAEAAERIKAFAKFTDPYTRAHAVTGITGFKRILFYAVSRLTSSPARPFEREADALEWLASA